MSYALRKSGNRRSVGAQKREWEQERRNAAATERAATTMAATGSTCVLSSCKSFPDEEQLAHLECRHEQLFSSAVRAFGETFSWLSFMSKPIHITSRQLCVNGWGVEEWGIARTAKLHAPTDDMVVLVAELNVCCPPLPVCSPVWLSGSGWCVTQTERCLWHGRETLTHVFWLE